MQELLFLEEKIFSLPGRGQVTFEAMQVKDRALDYPHRHFKSIHIAGTNGKGTVATKVAAGLQHAGYRVGLFTSPHLFTYRERIQINGEMIPESAVETLLAEVYDPELSFFDVLTSMAFLYFRNESVDFAVIEAGIGGRFDATNVIIPVLSIITSIGYDHLEQLGPTLEEVAEEKGGIIKPHVPCLVGPTAAPFFPNAPTILREPFFELENRSLAKQALKMLSIDSEAGLDTKTPFRFEKRGNILFDTAHNPSAFWRLKEALEIHYPGQTFLFFLAFSKSKDWISCVEIIRPIATSIQMVRVDHPRLRQSYPGFTNVEPQAISQGVVAGSFYLLSYFFDPKNTRGVGAIDPSVVTDSPLLI